MDRRQRNAMRRKANRYWRRFRNTEKALFTAFDVKNKGHFLTANFGEIQNG